MKSIVSPFLVCRLKKPSMRRDRPVFQGIVMIAFFMATIMLFGCGPEKPRRLEIGGRTATFSAAAIDGGKVALTLTPGVPVVLRFFQPDCPWCRADTKVFNDYYRRHGVNGGLKVIYIAEWQKKAEVEGFARKLKITFPVIFDPDGRIAALFQVKVLPQTIVISPDGKVIAAMVGGVAAEQLDEVVKPLLLNR